VPLHSETTSSFCWRRPGNGRGESIKLHCALRMANGRKQVEIMNPDLSTLDNGPSGMCHPGESIRDSHLIPNFSIRPPFSTASRGNVLRPTSLFGPVESVLDRMGPVDVVVMSQIGNVGPGSAMPCFDLVVMRRERRRQWHL
jgi:hypothetical protein